MEVTYVDIEKVIPDPDQPRKLFAANKMATLKASVKRWGIQQPLIVEKNAKGFYDIIDGERRYRTAQSLGLKKIPIRVIKTQSKLDKLIQQFHIQDQHENWTGVEKANAMMRLSQELDVPMRTLCEELALSPKEAENYLAYASLLERQTFERSEIPISWAKLIQQTKTLAKRVYQEEFEEEFDRNMEKKLERSIVNRALDGVINRDHDFSKLKDSFSKEPKTIKTFIDDAKITPAALFIKTKAKGAYALRNLINHAGWTISHANAYMAHKDVKPTQQAISMMQSAHEALGKVLALVE